MNEFEGISIWYNGNRRDRPVMTDVDFLKSVQVEYSEMSVYGIMDDTMKTLELKQGK